MSGGRGGPGRTSLVLAALATLLVVMFVAVLSVANSAGGSGGPSASLLLLGAVPFSLLAVLVVVLALSRPEGVEEVFLVHDSGLLLVHFSKTVRPEKDRDIVVGMLTAVQGFIHEAFPQGSGGHLRSMDFGERRILLAKGSYAYLAVILRGRVPIFLPRRMRRSLGQVERTYRTAIERWNGSPDSLRGADDVLFEGLLGDELRQIWTEARDFVLKSIQLLTRMRVHVERNTPEARRTGTDPRVVARRLMEATEPLAFKAEYREMLMTTLQEIRDGRLTLVGFGNLYMTIATQKNPKPASVGWWEMMMWTMREVLRTWPWESEGQAWVMPNLEPAPPAAPSPALFPGPQSAPPGPPLTQARADPDRPADSA